MAQPIVIEGKLLVGVSDILDDLHCLEFWIRDRSIPHVGQIGQNLVWLLLLVDGKVFRADLLCIHRIYDDHLGTLKTSLEPLSVMRGLPV